MREMMDNGQGVVQRTRKYRRTRTSTGSMHLQKSASAPRTYAQSAPYDAMMEVRCAPPMRFASSERCCTPRSLDTATNAAGLITGAAVGSAAPLSHRCKTASSASETLVAMVRSAAQKALAADSCAKQNSRAERPSASSPLVPTSEPPSGGAGWEHGPRLAAPSTTTMRRPIWPSSPAMRSTREMSSMGMQCTCSATPGDVAAAPLLLLPRAAPRAPLLLAAAGACSAGRICADPDDG